MKRAHAGRDATTRMEEDGMDVWVGICDGSCRYLYICLV